MKEDFSELVEYLDKKFGGVERRFDGVEHRLDGVERRLDSVDHRLDSVENSVIGLNNRLTTVEEKIEGLATKEDINRLYDAVDAYAKKADTYFQEMAAMAQKLRRRIHLKHIPEPRCSSVSGSARHEERRVAPALHERRETQRCRKLVATRRDTANMLRNSVAPPQCIAVDTISSSRLAPEHIGSYRGRVYV